MKYNLPAIRKLIRDAFGSDDFDIFCCDHYRDVYSKFSAGQTRTARIQHLLEYAEIQGQMDELLQKIKEENPYQYHEAEHKLIVNNGRSTCSGIQTHTSRLPETGPNLFGREWELDMLDRAWENPNIRVMTLVAWGGVGKTTLLNHWLNRMGNEDYRGAKRVYCWSFYSQGTREDRQASADPFINHALKWFGETPDLNSGSPWDMGVRLAELIREYRTLVILDGIEPLLHPQNHRLKDQGLQALLKELARNNSGGLCLISTRAAVKDLAFAETKISVEKEAQGPCARLELKHLAPGDGAELLGKLGVRGTLSERMETAEEFGGHALALNLLGRYLAVVHDGEISKRNSIPRLTEEEEKGGHARRVMESYETWLAEMPELSILNIMGLFDRPASAGAINVLTDGQAIPGLTNMLQNMPQTKWKYALKRLRDLKLLSEKGVGDPDALDCHPLVREHFREKLKNDNPGAWKEAHTRLYDYYRNLPEEYLPETREGMEPLFVAVAHGCMAGMHQEALDNVYIERIRRGRERFSVYRLGAFTSDLTALACFFDDLWSKPVKSVTDKDKADLLDWAGFRLRAVGQLEESVEPLKAASESLEKQGRFGEAAVSAGNLINVYLLRGKIKQALEYAEQSMRYAVKSESPQQILDANARFVDTFLYSGEQYESLESLEF